MKLGIDVYHIDRLIDWSLAKTRFPFAFIKASEYQIDPLFNEQWVAAKGHVLRGAYHFFRPLVNAQNAANMFCDILGDDLGEIEPAIDLEVFDGVTDLLERAKIFVDTVYARTGKKCIIYTNSDVLFSAGAGKKTIWLFWKYGWLREHRLWLAAPTNESNTFEYAIKVFNGEAVFNWPSPPPPFDKIHFLQWTWYGVPELVPGYYVGEYHKLQVDWNFAADGELGELPPVDPPPQGEPMKGTVITASLKVRTAPVDGAVIGGLSLNDLVEADRKENGWWHLTMIRGVATVGENWSYEGATQGYIRTDSDVPPTGLPIIHIHQLYSADGYPDKIIDEEWIPNA